MAHPAERRLARIATDIGWAQVRTTATLAALETIAATGYPGGGGQRVGGTRENTSVENAVLHKAREQVDELDARTAEVAGVVSDFVNYLKGLPAAVDPRLKFSAAAEALRARCTGGEGDWSDPHCANLEVRTIDSEEIGGVRIGVCWTCLSRRRRWRERQDEQAS